MKWSNRVVWWEGMFLRAQHFQQQDRWIEALVRARVAALRPHPWGLTEFAIDRGALATGHFALAEAAGVFEDGTPFDIPGDTDPPVPLALPPATRNQIVYLAVPMARPGAIEVATEARSEARWGLSDFAAADTQPTAPRDAMPDAVLQTGRLRLQYLLESDTRAGFLCIGLARVVEIAADRKVAIDPHWIPPSLLCNLGTPLTSVLSELAGLLDQRAEALAARTTAPGPQSNADQLRDLIFLQTVNRWQLLLAHWAQAGQVHPADLYAALLQLVGELATLADEKTRRPAKTYPGYRHDDLQRSFTPLLADLRDALAIVSDPGVVPIPLKEHPASGVHYGALPDRQLLDGAQFVLVVRAGVLAETLRQLFPKQVKIGPIEKIDPLIRGAVSGIAVWPLPTPPPKLAYIAGALYFELDRNSFVWPEMRKSAGFALHISSRGDFPDLVMSLFAIRGG